MPSDAQAKKDLFKAIFLDSSESESEKEASDDEDKEAEKLLELKKLIMEQTKPEPVAVKQPVAEKQPVAKKNEGFFADFDLSVFNRKPAETKIINEEPKELDSSIYGPKLPIRVENTWKPTFNKLSDRTTKKSEKLDEDDVVWVETDKVKDKKHKNEKKHKKHKDKDKEKHKKHKSKHKKKH